MTNLRLVSRLCVAVGILISIALIPFGGIPIQVQVVLALIALTIGIPHGAIDHLITVPRLTSLRMVFFLVGYLAVVALAIWAILCANLLGFQLVVLMSAIHFGLGDASFVAELDRRSEPAPIGFPKAAFVVASGFTPVVIPLVSDQSKQALKAVNPVLVDWSLGLAPVLFVLMVVVNLAAIAWMMVVRRSQEAIDLALLLTMSLVAPPLVAFAFYFGLWHALRHTGRVSLELKGSQQHHQKGRSWSAFWSAFMSGAPALVIVLVGTVILVLTRGAELSQDLLWYLLVVIWALTVPHMALTLRLDVKALSA